MPHLRLLFILTLYVAAFLGLGAVFVGATIWLLADPAVGSTTLHVGCWLTGVGIGGLVVFDRRPVDVVGRRL